MAFSMLCLATGLARDVVDLVIPPRCAGCLTRVRDPKVPICDRCNEQIRPCAEEIKVGCTTEVGRTIYLVSASRSCEPALTIIHKFKYSGSVCLAPHMADLMLKAVRQSPLPFELEGCTLVPIPLHPTRRRERGYNQSMLLAERLGWAAGAEIRDILVRTKRTKSQTALDSQERMRNVRGAFTTRYECPDIRVVIIDDVATSGATIGEAARAITTAGGTVIGAVTFVRA